MQKPGKRKWLRNVAIIFGALLIVAALSYWWLIREPRHIPGVIGLTEGRIRTYLGAPDVEGTFWLTEERFVGPADGVRYRFPETDFSKDSLLIKQYAWQGKSWDYRIWFKQQSGEWVVVEDLFWTDAIRF